MIWLAGISWFLVGLYGVFYNISYIDEAKYLIKGWLIATGQIGYYSTPEFFYQHMPGGLLWFGLGQRIFGPNLLVARFQSLLLDILIFYLTYLLAKSLAGKFAGKLSVMLLALAPVVGLYYASAVPQGLSVVVLLLALIAFSRQKYLLSTFWFAIAFIVRENFLFTLILYLPFLAWQLKSGREFVKNLLLVFAVLTVFFVPGWPGILKVLYNFPGVSNFIPASSAEKAVLGLSWLQQRYDLNLYLQAIKEFGVIYSSFIISLAFAVTSWFKLKIKPGIKIAWWLLITIAGFNFLAHTWGAFQLTPRAIISYFAYTAPLLAVIGGILIGSRPKLWLKIYPTLLIIALFAIKFASLAGHFNQPTDLYKINQSVKPLQQITAGKNNIIWLSEPMALYLAGRVSYYPLINHTNLFKPSNDTATVQSLGFWNQEMMSNWLNQADLVVIDSNRLSLMQQSSLARPTAEMIVSRLNNQFTPLNVSTDIWPGNLRFFQK